MKKWCIFCREHRAEVRGRETPICEDCVKKTKTKIALRSIHKNSPEFKVDDDII